MTTAAATTATRPKPFWPTSEEGVDAGFVLALVLLGLVGFRTTYGGWTFLLVGMVAAVLGVLVSHLADRLRQPLIAEAAVTIVIFFLLGGALATPGSALAGVLPTSSTLSSLASASTQGWKELLTTTPPVGNTSNLLTIPYLVGLVGGVAGTSLSRRTQIPAIPLIAPVVVLAVSILFGLTHPASLVLQGGLFAGGALAWVMLRTQRRRVLMTSSHRTRLAAAAGLLAVAAIVGSLAGPVLPFSGHQRVVLSRYVVPPFDVNDLPSPLAAFRRYTPGAPHSLSDTTLFTVSGLQAGARVRIATMDSYNDLVWGFGGAGTTGGATDVFRRYGTVIPAAEPGRQATVSVRIGGLGGQVWLPDVGEVTTIHFSGPHASTLSQNFRYDEATGTGANPTLLAPGDSYQMKVVLPADPSATAKKAAAAGSDQVAASVPPAVQATASQWVGSVAGAWDKVMKIAMILKTTGRFSHGTESPPLSESGHSDGRLTGFVKGGPLIGNQIVGDDEQYAAALALMSDAVGVPARVVLGATVGDHGAVTGAGVHAWVEVSLSGLGWVPIDYSTFLPTTAPTRVLPQPQPVNQMQTPVAPPTVSVLQPPPDNVLPQSAAASAHSLRPHHAGGFHVPAWLVTTVEDMGLAALAVLATAGTIMGLKAVRRRRRRLIGSPTARIAAGWHELVDQARDAGHPVPGGRTRVEQSGHVPGDISAGLAASADGAIFGPGDPSSEDVAGYWRQITEAGRDLRRRLGWRARLRAELNLASFRRSRHQAVRP